LDKRVNFNDPDSLQVFVSHFPSGTSFWTIMHFAQVALKKQMGLMEFDYGSKELNMKAYQQEKPPIVNFN
jgi:hypothetical protein